MVVQLEYSTGLVSSEAILRKFQVNFKQDPRLNPQFLPEAKDLIQASHRSFNISEFLASKIPLEQASFVELRDGKKDANGSKFNIQLSNPIYKTKKMKVNFVSTHKKASIVFETAVRPKNAQNLKMDVIYNYETIDFITISFPDDVDPRSLDVRLMLSTFEISSIKKFYILIGMIVSNSELNILTKIFEYDSEKKIRTRQTEFWIYPLYWIWRYTNSLVLWGSTDQDLKLLLKSDNQIIYLDQSLIPGAITHTPTFFYE